MSRAPLTWLSTSQALSSLEVAKVLGLEHGFLLARVHRMVADIGNPVFTALHFVRTGETYLLSEVAASLLAMDMDLEARALGHIRNDFLPSPHGRSPTANEEQRATLLAHAQQSRALTRRLHALVIQKRQQRA